MAKTAWFKDQVRYAGAVARTRAYVEGFAEGRSRMLGMLLTACLRQEFGDDPRIESVARNWAKMGQEEITRVLEVG